jgi:hypothetical protein
MEQKTYVTAHLALATYLDIHEVKLLRIQTDGNRCFLIFESRPDIDQLVNSFWAGEAVNARLFAERFRDMKAKIIEAKHGRRLGTESSENI